LIVNHSAQAELTASVDNVDDPYNNALADRQRLLQGKTALFAH